MKINKKKKYQIALRRYYSSESPSKEIAKYIGLSKNDFKVYIDSQKIIGMTIENFGKEWGLDHIVPTEVFDIQNEHDLKICYHYLNIMPMFNDDNRMKGGSIHFSIQKLEKKLQQEQDENNIEILNKLLQISYKELNDRYSKYLL